MLGRKHVKIIPGLWALGVRYNGVNKVSFEDLDPEMTILKSLKYYWTQNDVFFLMLSALRFRVAPLIHVKRLVELAKLGFLSNDETVLLIAIANQLVEGGDLRFKLVKDKLYKKNMTMNELPRVHANPEFVKIHGLEESLLEFGVKVRKFVIGEKKLSSMKQIFERNGWLKLRALIGANFKADVMYVKCSGQAKTAYQVAKIVGCGRSNAYSLLKFADEFDNLESILNVS